MDYIKQTNNWVVNNKLIFLRQITTNQ